MTLSLKTEHRSKGRAERTAPVRVPRRASSKIDPSTGNDRASPPEGLRAARRTSRSEQNSGYSARGGEPTFDKLSHRLRARADVSAGAKLLYADLQNIDAREKKGNVAPYQRTLADTHNVSVRQIRRYVEELEEGWLLTDEKRGSGKSSVYYLHDSWDVEWADDLLLPWQVKKLDGTNTSPANPTRGHFRPIGPDRSARLEDRSVLHDRTDGSSPIEKNIKRRTTRQDPSREDRPKHSVSESPPGAAPSGRCKCGSALLRSQIDIYLEGCTEWDPALGRTGFVINANQIHFHPAAADFIKSQLALVVLCFEQTHERRFKASRSRRHYRGSPSTSLDVQRGTLLTLEQNPTLAITDLVRAAKQGDLVALTPRFILKALTPMEGVSNRGGGSSYLSVARACELGLHEMGIDDVELNTRARPPGSPNLGRPTASKDLRVIPRRLRFTA
jgi:hypothetical protein